MNIDKKYIVGGLLATAAMVPLLDSTQSHASEIRTTTTRVHFRSGAGTDHSSMGVLDKGTKVTFIETSGDWTKVKYNSKTGYIYSMYLIKEESDSNTTKMYVTASSGLNVRKGPSTNDLIIRTLPNGTEVNVYSTSNGWSKIKVNGIEGYVSTKYLGSKNSSDSNITTPSNKKTMYVTANSGLNVRKGPSLSDSKITKLSKGTEVVVNVTVAGWSQITVNGIEGYVSSEYLSETNPIIQPPVSDDNVKEEIITPDDNTSNNNDSNEGTSEDVSVETVKMYVIAETGLNVRKGPSTKDEKIGTLYKGTEVTVHSTVDGWSKITVDGMEGYVSNQYLSETKPTTTASVENILNLAMQQLGKPYVWSATGPDSFDCSGFTSYVYKHAANITLPRVSRDQSRYGTSISRDALQAGDLVFFDTDGANNGGVTHVGIYVGNGEMIHASSSKRQIIKVSIDTSYWNRAFVNARRVI